MNACLLRFCIYLVFDLLLLIFGGQIRGLIYEGNLDEKVYLFEYIYIYMR